MATPISTTHKIIEPNRSNTASAPVAAFNIVYRATGTVTTIETFSGPKIGPAINNGNVYDENDAKPNYTRTVAPAHAAISRIIVKSTMVLTSVIAARYHQLVTSHLTPFVLDG